MNFKMYQRLKERALRQAQRELVTDPLRERVVFIAGRRRAESKRREAVPIHERIGSAIWVSPLAFWTKLDLNTYRLMHRDVPVNPVSGLLHMSGECLCGAFAHPGELDEIAEWFPGTAEEIRQLEAECGPPGTPSPTAHGATVKVRPPKRGRCVPPVMPDLRPYQEWMPNEPPAAHRRPDPRRRP